MAPRREVVQLRHPDRAKHAPRADRAYAAACRAALLAAIPATPDGVAFAHLADSVSGLVPPGVRAATSAGWWTRARARVVAACAPFMAGELRSSRTRTARICV